jgi:hypothetical protein
MKITLVGLYLENVVIANNPGEATWVWDYVVSAGDSSL